MSRLRIAFVKDWHDDLEHLGGNQDGILAAVAELSKRHNVTLVTRGSALQLDQEINGISYSFVPNLNHVLSWNANVIICWGSLDRPWHSELPPGVPALLCFAGGPVTHPNLSRFRHILVESKVYEDAFRAQGCSVSRAFGTNTQVFFSEPRTPKTIPALYPASFCFHKNQELFARAMGARGLCVGRFNELDIVGKCLQLGTPVLERVSSRALANLMNMSSVVVIPNGPNGGSQRTVLEAMACGVPVVLAEDNDKCREFVEESKFGILCHAIPESIREAVDELLAHPLPPQLGIDYIRSKWTEHHYADAIEKGILQCLNP